MRCLFVVMTPFRFLPITVCVSLRPPWPSEAAMTLNYSGLCAIVFVEESRDVDHCDKVVF